MGQLTFWKLASFGNLTNHIIVCNTETNLARLTLESPSTVASPFLFPSEDVLVFTLIEETDEPLERMLVLGPVSAVLSSRSSGNDTSNAVSLRRGVPMGRIGHCLTQSGLPMYRRRWGPNSKLVILSNLQQTNSQEDVGTWFRSKLRPKDSPRYLQPCNHAISRHNYIHSLR